MKKTLLPVFAALAVSLSPAMASEAQTCAQRAADITARQASAQELAKTRLALVDQVEAAGDAWEDVEVHRLASKAHADKADVAKARYDTLKSDLLQRETKLQRMITTLNQDVQAYNRTCARK